MASLETIGPLMTGMKSRADMAGLACEALNRMFQKEQTELVAQVTCHQFIDLFDTYIMIDEHVILRIMYFVNELKRLYEWSWFHTS